MYSQIAANKRKTVALIVAFIALLVLVGYGLGVYWGDVWSGMIVAAIVSGFVTVTSYFHSDTIALATSGAHVIEQQDHPALWHTVETLAITAGVPMPRVAIINDPAINAFATGRDPQHAVVAVTSGALQALTKLELEGVIAHELSHVKNYDIRLMTLVVVLVGTLALMADLFRWGVGGRGDSKAGGALAIIGIVLLILSPLIGQLIKFAVGRSREFLADASGALLTRYPEGLASALDKIARDPHRLRKANHATAHLFIGEPFRASTLTRLFSTHPPVEERVRRLRDMAA